ncbi:MAG TPA: TlpA disulfide reductase family protein [Terriglobales bacterium]|jgi:thiol-disulfide isomerase/thioredoxin|nr:TlpA disulfide reductase family protein [Terriglobales bacterium]
MPEINDGPVNPPTPVPEGTPPGGAAPSAGGSRNVVVLVVVIVAVALMLWVGVRQSRTGKSALAVPGAAMEIGQTAPDFELSTLDGKAVHLSDFRGKAVVLNFWATWCDPCKVEMPWLVDLQKQYGPQGLQIVGVAMDDSGKDEIQKFAQTMGVNYVVLQGKNAVGDAYGATGYPTTVYIDRSGKVVNKILGLVSKSEIEDNIKQALAGGGSQTASAPAAASQGK